VKLPVFSFLNVRSGPGLQTQLMTSNGETIQLNNGTSTSNFFMPSGSSTSYQFTVQMGIEIRLHKRVSINLDAIILAIADSTRRDVNGALTLGYTL